MSYRVHPLDCICVACDDERRRISIHPDSCSCDNCTFNRPRHRTRRRRRNPIWKDNERARKFWEACVIQELCSGDIAQTVRSADTALEAWRERWQDAPAEPLKNYGEVGGTLHSPEDPMRPYPGCNCIACEDGRRAAGAPYTTDGVNYTVPGHPLKGLDDYRPPVQPPAPLDPVSAHRFIPVTDNRYCGECGGGKLHVIHFPQHGITLKENLIK